MERKSTIQEYEEDVKKVARVLGRGRYLRN